MSSLIGIVGETASKASAQNKAWAHMLKRFGIDAEYRPIDLADATQLPDVLSRFDGLKIAPPFKEAAAKLRPCVGAAKRLGVANTVTRDLADNTDGEGMWHNLLEAFGELDSFLLLGDGGSCATISDALAQRGKSVLIWARKPGRRDVERIEDAVGRVQCVINTTPVGREGPLVDQKLVDPKIFAKDVCFASTLYRPERELMLRLAEENGQRVVNGLGMWLYQAAVAAKAHFFPLKLGGVPERDIAAALKEGLR